MKLDILAFAAHPDDVELSCAGTLVKHIQMGQKVGIVDLTRGELGTRGSAEIRDLEAAVSSKVLGVHYRHNLRMRDGFFEKNEASLLAIIQQIRLCQPKVVLANAIADRHIDHGRAADLVADACFLSGLQKINTSWEGQSQVSWRPTSLFHYIQDRYLKPDFVVDITATYEIKIASIKAFSSQFYSPDSQEPVTPISTADFLNFLEARSREMGRHIQATYGEGFTVSRAIGINDLTSLS